MLELLELFSPYMLFISFFVTIVFNLWLVSIKSNWIVIVIANLLLILIMEFLGLAEYNFLNQVVEWILDFIADVLSWIWQSTLGGLLEKIFGISPDRSYGGGGGGFRTR